MAFRTLSGGSLRQAATRINARFGVILAVAVLFWIAAVFLPPGQGQVVLLMAGAALGLSAIWGGIAGRPRSHDAGYADPVARQARSILDDDPAPSILTGAEGQILYYNASAAQMIGAQNPGNLAAALSEVLANPGVILFRMETRAVAKGAAVEDVVTHSGHLRISVHRAGTGHFLWRIEKSADRPQRSADPLPLPMLTVGRNDVVLFMNAAARTLIGERVRTLDQVSSGLPLQSGRLNDIRTPEGARSCFVVELEGAAGRREVFLLPRNDGVECRPDCWACFDNLPVPLLKLARDGTIQLSNRPARDLLGVPGHRGQPLGKLLEGLGRSMADWINDAADGRGAVRAEFLRVRREDREVFVQVTLNRATEEGEAVLIAVLSDATELKSLEAQFVQSQKMQAIGQLAGGVAHDFNNLLTAISGHCDLLLLRHDQGDQDYCDLMQINQNANRAAALVNQLLAYSRKQTLRPQVIYLRDTLSDLTHLLNRLVGEKVTLSLGHDPTLFPIRADRRQLEQVLMNLVVNARDAMPQGGDIRILTENVTLTEPLRRDRAVVAPGSYVSVKVIDAGVGIATDKLQKVFEPFFTTKRTGEGTGLGLSTAYGIVKQTGGFIFADSTPGNGTCFQLLFPAYHGREEVIEQTQPSDAPRGAARGLILLVEDEAPVRAFASRALQLRGFTVLEADSAETALDLLADETLRVDVFVTDVVMPGLDGPSWVRTALTARPDVKVVFMSGYAEETFGDTQAKIPNSVFLPKPFSLNELTETVQRQLSRA